MVVMVVVVILIAALVNTEFVITFYCCYFIFCSLFSLLLSSCVNPGRCLRSADKLFLLYRAHHWHCRPKPLVLAPLLSGTLSHLTVDPVHCSRYFCPCVKDGTVWRCLLHLVPGISRLWFACDTRRHINLFRLILSLIHIWRCRRRG